MPPPGDRERHSIPDLVPHTGVARLLTEIVFEGPGIIDALGEIPAAYPLLMDGRAPSFLGIELGAQAAAALGTLQWVAENGERGARVGYLVRIREAEFLAPELPVATPLRVTARLEGSLPPLALHRVSISVGGVDVVRALLSTYSELR